MVRLFTAHTNQGQASPFAGVADAYKAHEDAQRMDAALQLQADKAEHDQEMDQVSIGLKERELEIRAEDVLARREDARLAREFSGTKLEHDKTQSEKDRAARIEAAKIVGGRVSARDEAAEKRREAAAQEKKTKEEQEQIGVNSVVQSVNRAGTDLENRAKALLGNSGEAEAWMENNSQEVVGAIAAMGGATPDNIYLLRLAAVGALARTENALDVEVERVGVVKAERLKANRITELQEMGVPPEVIEEAVKGGEGRKALLDDANRLTDLATGTRANEYIVDEIVSLSKTRAWLGLDAALKNNLTILSSENGDENSPGYSGAAALFGRLMNTWYSDESLSKRNAAGRQLLNFVQTPEEIQGMVIDGQAAEKRQAGLREMEKKANKAQQDIANGAAGGSFDPNHGDTGGLLAFLSGNADDPVMQGKSMRAIDAITTARLSWNEDSGISINDHIMVEIAEVLSEQDLKDLGAAMIAAAKSPEFAEFKSVLGSPAAGVKAKGTLQELEAAQEYELGRVRYSAEGGNPRAGGTLGDGTFSPVDWEQNVKSGLDKKGQPDQATLDPKEPKTESEISSSIFSDPDWVARNWMAPEAGVLQGFLKSSKTRHHAWTKDIKNDPGTIWKRVRADARTMSLYLKYLKNQEKMNKRQTK